MSGLSDNQIQDMLWRDRPMAVTIEGVWRGVIGRYAEPLKEPWTARIIFNGRIYFVQYFLDFDGCNEEQLTEEVIVRNIQSLPPPPKKKQMFNVNRPAPRAFAGYVHAQPDYTQLPAPGYQWAFRARADGGEGIEAIQVPILNPAAEIPLEPPRAPQQNPPAVEQAAIPPGPARQMPPQDWEPPQFVPWEPPINPLAG